MKAKSFTLGLLLLASLASGWAAAAVELNESAPQTYTVKKGDTLWAIAGMYLKKPWLWPEIWDVNPQLDNPHLIYPGDILYLVWVDGKPRLQRKPGGGPIKLEPGMRISPLDLAIPVIPLDEIGAFLKRHRVLSAEELEQSAYVVAGDQGHLLSAPGDIIYGRGDFSEDERAYGIYRRGDTYIDPVTSELLGYQAQDIGNATRRTTARSEVVELQVTRVTEEVRITDRLLPMEERVLDATFQPRAPTTQIEDGYMIAVDQGVSQIGTTDIVVMNKGSRDGLEVGHVMAIFQTGELVYDQVRRDNVQLPDTRAGLLLVFETYDKVSYGVVLKANRPLKIMDKVKNP